MEARGSFVVGDDHPALPGHFPGRPIVPGVVLLDELAALIAGPGRRIAGFPTVRFLRPVRPGEAVAVVFGEGRFSATVAGAVVVQGSVDLAEDRG